MKWPILLQRKPTTIRAMRWTGDNYSDIRSWGAPVTFMGGEEGRDPESDLWLWIATISTQVRLEEGEWITQEESGFNHHSHEHIVHYYTEVEHA